MKHSKMLKLANEVETFKDMWDLSEIIYNSKNYDFELIRKNEGWLCKVVKVKKIMNGKDVSYKRIFQFKESGNTMVEAFKTSALRYLGK